MESYGSLEGLSAYAAAVGRELPQAGLAKGLLRGSAFIDGVYADRFTGHPAGGIDQDRAWPRTGATAFGQAILSTIVPKRVEHAAYEAALIELQTPGRLSVVANFAFKIELEGGGERMFIGLVMSAQEAGGEANTIQNLTATIEINSNVVKVAA